LKKLNVFLRRAPDQGRIVGQLAETGGRLFFEYDAEFLRRPLWLSPFKLPPEPGLREHTDRAFGPIFGLFADSLPDGWGLLLMDRAFRKAGLEPSRISILDRLAYLGADTMGALVYEPALIREPAAALDLDLRQLAAASRHVLAGDTEMILPLLHRAGGSPGGARPKVLVGVGEDRLISGESNLPEGVAHWMIKFPGPDDPPDAGPIEYAYASMAGSAGIAMPRTRLFSAGGEFFFGVLRFDRNQNQRFHVHTLGNLIHSNYRIPSCDYMDFCTVTRILTRNHQDVLQAFRLMIFNILTHNRDDHVKNVAYMMDDQGDWRLAPAYDLTYAPGPGGEHSMTVMGEGGSPGCREIMDLGRKVGLRPREISHMLDQVVEAVGRWPGYAEEAGVTAKSKAMLRKVFQRTIDGTGVVENRISFPRVPRG
jgi:serine/threonine-protein kinase HipA